MAKDPTAGSPTAANAQKLNQSPTKDRDGKAPEDKGETALPNLGLPDSAGHKGTISVDGETPVEGLLLAYQSVDKIAAKICERVLKHQPRCVLMHNLSDFNAIKTFKAFKVESDLVRSDLQRVATDVRKLLDDLTGRKLLVSGAVIGAGIASALQLASLFRVDYKLKYSKLEIEDQVLAVTVAGAIKKAGKPVYNTALVPLASQDASHQSVFGELDELKKLRSELVGLGDRLHALIGDQEAAKTTTEAPNDPVKSRRSEVYARVVAAVAGVDAFVNNLSRIDETTNVSRLSQLIDAQDLIALMDDKTFVLWVKAVAAGGGSRSRESTFFSDLTYSGGAIASFALYGRDGELLEADTISMYSGFVRIGNLPEGELAKFSN